MNKASYSNNISKLATVNQAKEDEISEIKAQRDFELTREVGEQRRCKIDW